jgi:hypothetical protein
LARTRAKRHFDSLTPLSLMASALGHFACE